MRVRRLLTVPVLLLALAGFAGCAGSSTNAAGSPGGSTPAGTDPVSTATTVAVAKQILAQQVDPPGTTGRTLTLIRYIIAPGAKLSPHIHPGIQLAEIESGQLTYTVVSGTVTVRHGGATGTTEQVTGPTTITLAAGDSVSEVGDMVHFGANDTSSPVVILATLLTESDKDLAVTVTTLAN